MNLQPVLKKIAGKKEFLRNTVGVEYKTGGATLDASQFTDGEYVEAGTAVYKDADTGLYVPWADTGEGGAERPGAGLTSHDVYVADGSNPIVGVVVAGHPLENKCTGVTDGFKDEVKGYLRFDA